jgi:phosphohistidine phosphatase SixA
MADDSVELFLLRHAHAGDPARWQGDDALRPLSAKGRLQADTLARHLTALGLALDLVVSSPRVRARETAEPIARALGLDVVVDPRVAMGLDMGSLEELLADRGNPARPLVVGHDPDVSDLVADLVGVTSLPMRKGALVRVDAPRPLRPASGILRWLLPPDALVPNAKR